MTSTGFILAAETAADTAHEDSGGSFLVQPDIGLMIWTLVVFGIAMVILARAAWPRISAALEKRQRMIEESIDAAETAKSEAAELLEEYRERLKQARAQADEIVARARKAGEVAEREAVEQAREKREELLAQTRRDIEAETRRAIQEIRNEVADLTILATEKVTRKSLDQGDQQRLVEEALSELDFGALSGERRN